MNNGTNKELEKSVRDFQNATKAPENIPYLKSPIVNSDKYKVALEKILSIQEDEKNLHFQPLEILYAINRIAMDALSESVLEAQAKTNTNDMQSSDEPSAP